MADYIELPLTADATALGDTGKEYLQDQIEGWEPRPGNAETVLIEASGQMGAEVVDQAALVPPVIFAYYGQWLLGITLREATPATGQRAIHVQRADDHSGRISVDRSQRGRQLIRFPDRRGPRLDGREHGYRHGA
jgi:hypothetical protein